SALAVTFVAGVGFSTFSVLSPGRAYAIGSILIGVVVAAGLLNVLKRLPANHVKKMMVLCSALVITFASVSVAKFPTYIVSDVAPLRGHESIDDVPYWRISLRDE